jgi:hypothetical protein
VLWPRSPPSRHSDISGCRKRHHRHRNSHRHSHWQQLPHCTYSLANEPKSLSPNTINPCTSHRTKSSTTATTTGYNPPTSASPILTYKYGNVPSAPNRPTARQTTCLRFTCRSAVEHISVTGAGARDLGMISR